MHSNFITPPDYVESILIVDASQAQIQAVAEHCKTANTTYNVYLYSSDMNNTEWLSAVASRADVILKSRGTNIDTVSSRFPIWFGPDEKLTNPVDYFNK